MREAAPLEPVLRTRFDSRIYDGNLWPGPGVDSLELSLYRVTGREDVRPRRR